MAKQKRLEVVQLCEQLDQLTIVDCAILLFGDRQRRRTLQNWFDQGAPKNADGTVSLPALVRWRIHHKEVSEAAAAADSEQRGKRSEADAYRRVKRQREQLRLRKDLAQVISVERLMAEVGATLSRIRMVVERRASTIAPQLVGRRLDEIARLLAAEDAHLLASLADAIETASHAVVAEGRDVCQDGTGHVSSPSPTSESPGSSAARGRRRSGRAKGSRARRGRKNTSR